MSKPELKPQRLVLNDGTSVLIRPIRPDDKVRLRDGLARLSERSRYHRFAMVVRELSAEHLRYLTEIDYDDHMAWVAIDSGEEVESAVGVARYIRLHSDPAVAEVAVTIADSYQDRGLGTLLLAKLAQSARLNGVQRFLAFVLWNNAPVLKVARAFGATVRSDGSGMMRVTGSVPETPDEVPRSSW